MGEVASQLSYKGTFIQIQQDEIETLEVTHKGGEEGSRERLMALTGSLRELVRDNESVKCIHARESGGEVDLRQSAARFHSHLGSKLHKLEGDHYSLVDLGSDRIAGRDTRVIGVRPNDGYRYGFRFWLDEANGMALRSDMVDPEGAVLQKVMFTQIDFNVDIDEAALTPLLDAEAEEFTTRHARYSRPDTRTGDAPKDWSLDDLPKGFRVSGMQEDNTAGGGTLYHFVLSDGLAQVSVFLEPLTEDVASFEGESRIGTMNAFGRQQGDHQLTVVGEVPETTVNRIAKAFQGIQERILEGDSAQ